MGTGWGGAKNHYGRWFGLWMIVPSCREDDWDSGYKYWPLGEMTLTLGTNTDF